MRTCGEDSIYRCQMTWASRLSSVYFLLGFLDCIFNLCETIYFFHLGIAPSRRQRRTFGIFFQTCRRSAAGNSRIEAIREALCLAIRVRRERVGGGRKSWSVGRTTTPSRLSDRWSASPVGDPSCCQTFYWCPLVVLPLFSFSTASFPPRNIVILILFF